MEPMFEITEEKQGDNYSKFIISPLPYGYGNTLGVALRRVLLSSLKGSAITQVKIAGVKHQFSSLTGMKEDVLDFLLNLKKVRFTNVSETAKATLDVTTSGEVKAGDIKVSGGVKVANPDLVLANLSKGAKLSAALTIESGVGYSPFEERVKEGVGVIALDALFSPIVRVNYKVEETRVGRITNYDKLSMEVWTDGTIKPNEAVKAASNILVSCFNQIVNPKEVSKKVDAEVKTVSGLGQVGKLSVEEIGLPTRVANALAKAGYETVEKLVNAKREDLMHVRNLGEKSLKIIRAALMEKGVEFNV
ncbi:MAG TPA: DNA-directed RNA polymerase subunit alpha [Patescibacteria group bacterium]|nr:DNA-directed RNA polymerase subunit alpha [Patescibacteria group bacterium]